MNRAETRALEAERSAEAAQRAVERMRSEVAQLSANAARTVATAAAEADSAVRNATTSATVEVHKAVTAARQSVRVMAALESAAVNAEGYWEQGAALSAGSVMPLPAGLVYYPGRAMLRVCYQGAVLSRGVHYDEVGDGNALSDSIRVLFDSRAGSQWSFWVVASNVSAGAEEAAKRAEQARQDVQQAALRAGRDADEADTARKLAETAADHAGRWLDAVKTSADEAYRLAVCAWSAAYQSGMAASRPGIAAVKGIAELAHCVCGLYVVNPHLTHSPTVFMGVWPVDSLDDITWDGVFFFGTAYPDNPAPPPIPCDPPVEPGPNLPGGEGGNNSGNNSGNNLKWKPCGRA